MEAKLIKSEEGYSLIDLKGNLIAQTFGKFRGKKMSLRKCQAIERGYDLDELLDNITPKNGTTGNISERIGFVKGFQKALELLGDKKYSEKDVLDIVFSVINELVLIEGFDKKYLFPETIYQEITTKCKSLQQTEWDVEVEMEWNPKSSRCDECGEGGNYMNTPCDHPHDCNHWSAKYDSENCLILKRI